MKNRWLCLICFLLFSHSVFALEKSYCPYNPDDTSSLTLNSTQVKKLKEKWEAASNQQEKYSLSSEDMTYIPDIYPYLEKSPNKVEGTYRFNFVEIFVNNVKDNVEIRCHYSYEDWSQNRELVLTHSDPKNKINPRYLVDPWIHFDKRYLECDPRIQQHETLKDNTNKTTDCPIYFSFEDSTSYEP